MDKIMERPIYIQWNVFIVFYSVAVHSAIFRNLDEAVDWAMGFFDPTPKATDYINISICES